MIIAHTWKFAEEKERQQLNPIASRNVDAAFGKELARQRITMLTFKQWLFWRKLQCLSDVRAPHLAAMVAEIYLVFLQKYQVSLHVPEILRTMMTLQSCYMIAQRLAADSERTLLGVAEIQQRFFYSALSRLYFQQKQYLRKAVELLYSMKPLSMKEQHAKGLGLLEKLAEGSVHFLVSRLREHRTSTRSGLR